MFILNLIFYPKKFKSSRGSKIADFEISYTSSKKIKQVLSIFKLLKDPWKNYF